MEMLGHMGKIYIATCAYNAEKTLVRCIESVLKQTYTNFMFYICDNGSEDLTGKIIEQYAALDSRIVPSSNARNHDWSDNPGYVMLPHNISVDDYYCLLDADDELELSFFEEMLDFIQKNNLDMCACGSSFINAKTNIHIGKRNVDAELIIKNASQFSDQFAVYHQFMRTGWAKLFTGKLAHKRFLYSDYPKNFPRAYGGDTFIVFHCLRYANRIGIYPKPLHKYYVSEKSRSYKFNTQRISCDRILLEDAFDFLRAKCGYVSSRNKSFLYAVYLSAIIDTLNVLINSEISVKRKISGIIDIFSNEYTKKLIALNDSYWFNIKNKEILNKRRDIIANIVEMLLKLKEVPDELFEEFCNTGELLCAAIEYADGWLYFKKLRVGLLIYLNKVGEARVQLDELEELIPSDKEVAAFRDIIEKKV